VRRFVAGGGEALGAAAMMCISFAGRRVSMATKVKGKVEFTVSLALGLIALAGAYLLWTLVHTPGQSLLPPI
jgi:hypothetical protein